MFLMYEHILILHYIIQGLKIFFEIVDLNKKEKHVCFSFQRDIFHRCFFNTYKYSIFKINNICVFY